LELDFIYQIIRKKVYNFLFYPPQYNNLYIRKMLHSYRRKFIYTNYSTKLGEKTNRIKKNKGDKTNEKKRINFSYDYAIFANDDDWLQN